MLGYALIYWPQLAPGIRTQTDVLASRRQYVKNRLEWERQLGAFAAFAGYDWEEITGDRDLQAAEEPVDEPVG